MIFIWKKIHKTHKRQTSFLPKNSSQKPGTFKEEAAILFCGYFNLPYFHMNYFKVFELWTQMPKRKLQFSIWQAWYLVISKWIVHKPVFIRISPWSLIKNFAASLYCYSKTWIFDTNFFNRISWLRSCCLLCG